MLTCYLGITYLGRIVTTNGGFNVNFSANTNGAPPPLYFFLEAMAHLNYSAKFEKQVKNHWHYFKLLSMA